jgi:hypothetical protein
MSLETKIDALTAAVVALTQAMSRQPAAALDTPAFNVAPAPAAPVAPVAPVAPAITMPAAPTFQPAAPAAPAGAPFTDTKGLIEYATAAYHALTAKGPGWNEGLQRSIDKVAGKAGADINELTPAQYPAFYAAIEALKA